MTPEEKKLIELLEHHCNDNANTATAQKRISADENKTVRANFWQGQYQAYSSMYTMLQNLKRTL